MSILFSSLFASGGGGGLFVASFSSTGIGKPNGQTGTFITITPPAGKRVLLNTLIGRQDTVNVELLRNGVVVVGGAGKTLSEDGHGTDGYWSIAPWMAGAGSGANGAMPSQLFDIDDVVTVRMTSGSSAGQIGYNYSYGDLI